MEPRISLITLGVADVTRSRRFYEALGWRASTASVESTAFFVLGPVVLALWGLAALREDAGLAVPDAALMPGAVALAHNVRTREEVDAVLAAAHRAGARQLRPARAADWGGYTGYFADPDGHLWEVAWNPHFPLREDGSLALPD